MGKLERRLRDFVNTNGFIYAIYISAITVVLGGVGIYYLEYNQVSISFGDSLWWSFVTASTVGFVDMAPETGAGRLIAVVLMIVGIGFVGMLTGIITTYFLNFRRSSENAIEIPKVIDVSDLEDDEVNQIVDYLDFIRSKNK